MTEEKDIQGMDVIYGREVLRNYFEWYNSFDDIDFTAIPFEPFVSVQDYNCNWYSIPQRLQKYFIASLTKNDLDKRFEDYRSKLNHAA